ncbi:MAG: sensor histidine kinase [Cellulophaga sp.]|nr:sensor histidine kinase [Cellulophaga sp.]
MKKIAFEIKRSKYFLLFVFLFAYAQSIQVRFLLRQQLNWYIFTPEAALVSLFSACILFVILNFFMERWQKSEVFNLKELSKIVFVSVVIFLIVMKFLGLIAAVIFDTFERNFNSKTLALSISSNLMDAFIYGSFFLAYYYYRKYKKNQIEITNYNQALAESKINQLKAQLNPHFLFNNLNVLDQLIEEDKYQASEFLNEFAEIYRYVLQVSDQKIISISEELTFVQKYFNLMKHKYGNAYILEIETESTKGNIVPLTLQLLLENAIQHNLGKESAPITIKISIKDVIMVSNNIIPKLHSKATSGRAINNLNEQYGMLSKSPVEITRTEYDFSVSVPII